MQRIVVCLALAASLATPAVAGERAVPCRVVTAEASYSLPADMAYDLTFRDGYVIRAFVHAPGRRSTAVDYEPVANGVSAQSAVIPARDSPGAWIAVSNLAMVTPTGEVLIRMAANRTDQPDAPAQQGVVRLACALP